MDYVSPHTELMKGNNVALMTLCSALLMGHPLPASANTQISPTQATKSTPSTRPSRRRSNLSEYVHCDAIKSVVSRNSTFPKAIPTSSLGKKASSVNSFYDRVENVMQAFGLNKSQLSAVLNVQRKSVYDWRAKPEVEVREVTVKRVQIFEEFLNYMDKGHSPLVGKLSFGSLGHLDLASALTDKSLNIIQLKELYDSYWLEFDGMYKRSILARTTKEFENAVVDEASFIGI